MRVLLVWLSVTLVCASLTASKARAQDTIDRDSWNVPIGEWDNGENWVDETGSPSDVPTTSNDRWAFVGSGTAQVSGVHMTSGLEIGNGTVEILSGASFEVALENDSFSVGQTQVNTNGTLRIAGNGSFKGLDGNILGTVEMNQGGSFEFAGNLNLHGTFDFEVTAASNSSVKVGGAAAVGGIIAPRFSNASPTFGAPITFVEGNSVTLLEPTLQLPVGVSLPFGLQAQIIADANSASIAFSNVPVLQVDRGTADARIMNVVGGPIEMTGYVIKSALETLQPGKFSGFGGATWDRPNPLASSIAEFSLTQTRSVAANEELEIGKIYNGGAVLPRDEDVTFSYFTPDGEILEGLVEYVGPANDLVLNANPITGEVTLQHLSSFIDPIEVTGYSVLSSSESLNVEQWTSLEKAGESGWLETTPRASLISELNWSDSTIFTNGTVLSLGNIFETNGPPDLVFQYTTATELFLGTVEYQSATSDVPPRLGGDFNSDGIVDFADFLTLSANFGKPGTAAQGDVNGDGIISFPDFLTMSANFGKSAAAVSIPEPDSLALFGLGSILFLVRRRRSPQRETTMRQAIHKSTSTSVLTYRSRGTQAASMTTLCFLALLSLSLVGYAGAQAHAVEDFTVSNWGEGIQIWWEAEDFDERIPDTDDLFTLSAAPDGEEAFGSNELNTINRNGAGGRISYTFDINQLGSAGTWYFWGRVINPSNQSDFLLLENHPGDVIPTEEPFAGAFSNEQRIFERNTGPPFGWSGGSEGHVKQLQDGLNTMHIVHRSGNPSVFWDVMMWTDDADYIPTDDDYLDSAPFVLNELVPGDFNLDSTINIADYQILVSNFNTAVERGMDGDINFNGFVDERDFVMFRSTYDARAVGAVAVPEPNSLFLFGAGLLVASVARRRRRFERTTKPQSQDDNDATVGMNGGRLALSVLVVCAISIFSMPMESIAQVVIRQAPETDFIAFEAEDVFEINHADDANGWSIVGVNSFTTTPDSSPGIQVLTEGAASRNGAVFDLRGGNDQDFLHYRLEFVEFGEYSLYLKVSLYDILSDGGVGQEDSIYVSSEFGTDGLINTDADPRGDRDSSPSYYSGGLPKGANSLAGNFGWWNASPSADDPTTVNIDGIYDPILDTELDFGIATRERGVAIDRIVFHINPDLSPEELDTLPSYDLFTLGIAPGDFNQDGTLDFADFSILRENFGGSFDFSESFEKGDVTRDGRVNLADFIEIRRLFNGDAQVAAAVPEPHGIIFVLPAVVALLSVRRRR